uniref:RRM domain-containing protein n=1 Tax=Diacronema lutheri TaxID=2081491 RepID=A0A7R9YIC1_DIALT
MLAARATACAKPERAISLANFALEGELDDAEERADLAETLREECATFGRVASVIVPPAAAQVRDAHAPAGAGGYMPKVYVLFEEIAAATAALARMHGRAFDGRIITAAYVPQAEYDLVQARAVVDGGNREPEMAQPQQPQVEEGMLTSVRPGAPASEAGMEELIATADAPGSAEAEVGDAGSEARAGPELVPAESAA